MKKSFLFIFSLLPLWAAAQKSYTVSGSLPGVKVPAKAFLNLFTIDNGWKTIDSTEIKGGRFEFNGSVKESGLASIEVRRNVVRATKKDALQFLIENSRIGVIGADSVSKAKVTGSVADKENREREAMVSPLNAKINELGQDFKKRSPGFAAAESAEEIRKAQEAIGKLQDEIKEKNLKFVESHLNSFPGIYAFYMFVLDKNFVAAKVEPLFNSFPDALRSSSFGVLSAEKIKTGKRRAVGANVTDFTQNDVNGKPFSLSSLRGKWVLVDFWASWCKPCRAENPNLLKAYNRLRDKNFEIVGVSLDSYAEMWKGAIKEDGMPWIQVSDLKGGQNKAAVIYGISAIPQNLLIDPEGVIVARNLRGEDLPEKLSAFIK